MTSLPKRLRVIVLLIVCAIAMIAQGESEVSGAVVVLEINGTIGPATGDYIERSLEKANQQQFYEAFSTLIGRSTSRKFCSVFIAAWDLCHVRLLTHTSWILISNPATESCSI